MQIRNFWFELFTFLIALLMAMSCISSIGHAFNDPKLGRVPAIVVPCFFLIMSVAFFWASLEAGAALERRRARRVAQKRASAAIANTPPQPPQQLD